MLIQSTLCLAAQEIASIQTRYAKKGLTLSEVALCGAKEFIEWNHYPANDLVDEVSGYEFYYHAHSADEMVDGDIAGASTDLAGIAQIFSDQVRKIMVSPFLHGEDTLFLLPDDGEEILVLGMDLLV